MTRKTKAFPESNLPPDIQEKADRMNLDEAAVPPFEMLPLPFTPEMTPAEKAAAASRTLEVFTKDFYGEIPPRCQELKFVETSSGTAFDGLAERKEIDIICSNNGFSKTFHMLIYIPAERQGKVPCFLGMNFRGNTATTFDPEVTFHPYTRFPDPSPWWDDIRVLDEKDRGSKAYRWNFETVIKAGFASATFCLCDVFTDHPTGYSDSIMPMFYSEEEYNSDRRKSAAISAWAWGLMRGIDALESLDCIDKNKIIVHGHSRMGKTAIWAGVNDPRIAMTVSSGSGAAGAKISRRYFGENMEWLDQWRKYWFVPGFEKYCGKDTVMPFDQHQLMALIAPRKLFVTSSNNDGYADPVGEFLATKTASEAWGKDGIDPDTPMPAPGNGVGENSCRYYIREGEHDFTLEQWQDLLKFASAHFL